MEVVNGQADAFIYDMPFQVVFMAQQGGKNLVLLDQVFTYEPLGLRRKEGRSRFSELARQLPASDQG